MQNSGWASPTVVHPFGHLPTAFRIGTTVRGQQGAGVGGADGSTDGPTEGSADGGVGGTTDGGAVGGGREGTGSAVGPADGGGVGCTDGGVDGAGSEGMMLGEAAGGMLGTHSHQRPPPGKTVDFQQP
jgi:hypothetical protein